MFLTTYMTASMVLPIAQRTKADVLVLNLQPTESMDHATFDTGQWLAYCGACPLPEVANTFERSGIGFRSVSGYLADERAWTKIERWIQAAGVRRVLQTRPSWSHGPPLPGHARRLDRLDTWCPRNWAVTSRSSSSTTFACASPTSPTPTSISARHSCARSSNSTQSVEPDELEWGVRVALGLETLVKDFELDSLAYYHRGLEGELHERIAAGMILGASLLTAGHVPACGEYELRTSLAMLDTGPDGRGRFVHRTPGAQFPRQRGRDGPRRTGALGDQ